ncbi:MAG: DUF4345 family protein [Chloroflexota bacterium]
METILDILKVVACLGLIVFGAIAIVRPRTAAALVQMRAESPRALTETRVNLGGFIAGMGVIPLLLNDPAAYQVAGGAYLAAVGGRVVGMWLDRPQINVAFIIILAFEIVSAVVLLLV